MKSGMAGRVLTDRRFGVIPNRNLSEYPDYDYDYEEFPQSCQVFLFVVPTVNV